MDQHIETTCEGCGVTLRVEAKYAARQAKCPQCGRTYQVPELYPNQPAGGFEQTMPYEPSPPKMGDSPSWYLQTPEGHTYGPVGKNELDRWTQEGRVNYDCQVKNGDLAVWKPAWEIYPQLSQSATSGGNPFRAPVNDGPVQYASQSIRTYQEHHRGGLILTFGILAFVIQCPLFGILAWIMGSGDLAKIKSGQMDPEGKSLTQAGMILGIVSTCILLLIILGFIPFLGLFFMGF